MTGPVVVGVDDFEHSDRLIATAAREARLRQGALWLAHAYHGYTPAAQGVPPGYAPEEIVRDAAEEQLAAVAERLKSAHPDLRVETAVLAGPTASALSELSDKASLLVVGGRGRGGLAGQLLGSVALGVLAHAHCPVLVVRGDREQDTERVMVGVDVADPATGPEVMEFAFKEAAARKANLYAFYAWEDPALFTYGSKLPQAHHAAALKWGREGLARVVEPWQLMFPEVRVSSEVLAGLPAKLLVESTDLADLVVIGGKARDRKDGMRVGGIAHTVLHHAHCPVAIVPEH